MRYWQRAMIYCARHKGLTEAVHRSSLMGRFARQFVAAEESAGAVARMQALQVAGIAGSLFYLGEYVTDTQEIAATVAALREAIPVMKRQGLDVHVSVDPTQIGSLLSWELCRENAEQLARAIHEQGGGPCDMLMLDMEDSGVTQQTLDLHSSLRKLGLPVAITLQSALFRTTDDLHALIDCGATVRLVKGAFAEPATIAHVKRQDVDDTYRMHMAMLLSQQARNNGVYPVFGTHDDRMMRFGDGLARAGGWGAQEYEVEMLLGVRPALQRERVAAGFRLRLYCPFGKSWWPYSVRRIGENPRNALFVVRSLVGR